MLGGLRMSRRKNETSREAAFLGGAATGVAARTVPLMFMLVKSRE